MSKNPKFIAWPRQANNAGSRSAVVLVNLGTPDAPTATAVRRYLAEFLWDPRVIETPRWLWWLILNGVILRIRPARSARAYKEIWTEAGSPLLSFSRRLTDRVRAALEPEPSNATQGQQPLVRLAMRYGQPSLPDVLRELGQQGIDRLLVLPLYPQYSAATTASTFDALSLELRRWRRLPELRFVMDYHADPRYLAALVESVRTHWAQHGRAELLLFSFHGLPQRYVDAGDPYFEQCRTTVTRLAAALDLGDAEWRLCFQSRVGREPWLMPYTEALLEHLPQDGVRAVQVICPGFAVDCLETLEEIVIRGRQIFLAAGGQRFEYIAALNDTAAHAAAIAGILRDRLADWTASASPSIGKDAELRARAPDALS